MNRSKEQLLQNEILHLGQIIQTLSYELVVLQDFLKEEHGSKFEAFRTNYSPGNDSLPASDSSSSSKSRRKLGENCEPSTSMGSSSIEAFANAPEDDKDNMCFSPEGEFSYNEFAFDESSSEDDVNDSQDTSVDREKKGGRRKTKIWKYFDSVSLDNNRISARCHICRNLVSARATRMVEHRTKCKRNTEHNLHGVKRNFTREFSDEIRKIRKEEGKVSKEKAVGDSIDCRAEEDLIRRKSGVGRHFDIIWAYFEVAHDNGLKKAKCLTCGQLVSPKAGRMRQHKVVCKETDAESSKVDSNSSNTRHAKERNESENIEDN